MKKLNIGCGYDYKKGWVNLDFEKAVKPDVFFDLREIQKGKNLPFKSKSFNFILMKDVLEHLDEPTLILKELYRVCKVGGIIEIHVPYGDYGYNEMSHKRNFIIGSFEAINFHYSHQRREKEVKLIHKSLYTTTSKKDFFGRLRQATYKIALAIINPLIRKSPSFYDMTILRYLFPQTEIYIKYKKIN